MAKKEKIYILGCGAIGLALVAYLADAGRDVVAVRTSRDDVPLDRVLVVVQGTGMELRASVEMTSLAKLAKLDGMVVVTAKSYANPMIAAALMERQFAGPIIILQNGLGVETPFVAAGFAGIYRCVLYATAQIVSENAVTFRPIHSCPIGIVQGEAVGLEAGVRSLSTAEFSFHAASDIQRDVWKKAIINSVFNSICPLLGADNGIFVRDPEVFRLAEEIVAECLVLAEAKGVALNRDELLERIRRISQGSQGVLISTLQDIKNGRDTEIRSLNLELARLAATMNLSSQLPRTELLGRLVLIKSGARR